MTRHIPNFITCLNLSSGFIAILYAFNGEPLIASWLILAAMVFDFFDGFSARLLKAYSPIGKELDSLADMVSFGIAPASIIFQFLTSALGIEGPFTYYSETPLEMIILFSPLLMPVCAALRLAKFNIDDTQKNSFKGLATPASALAIVTIVFAREYSISTIDDFLLDTPQAIIILSTLLSILMVTRVPMISLKFHNLNLKENLERFILIILVLSSIIVFGIGSSWMIIPIYIVVSIASLLFRR